MQAVPAVPAAPVEAPNDRWVLTGAFSHINDRAELLEDLEAAVKPSAPPRVLALFGFKHLAERLQDLLEPDANLLLGRIADRLASSADPLATLYESRRGEFCALFDGRLRRIEPLLDEILHAIDREVASLGIETVATVVSLPGEAASPIGALRLADQRREEAAGHLRLPPRQNAYARIMATLHPVHASGEDPAA